jgi:long-chain acyl-CoA synthetase
MENNSRYLEVCAAGERTGLYYTCVDAYLKSEELAYILNNSESQLLETSAQCFEIARNALPHCPGIALCLVVGGAELEERIGATDILSYASAVADLPVTPVADESLGTAMLYSSGTTGRDRQRRIHVPH